MKLKGKALLSLLIVLTLLVQLFAVSAAADGESLSWVCEPGDVPELDYAVQAGGSIDELMYSGLSINPPDGWYVQSAWIEGGDGASGTPLPLTADPGGSASVSVDREVFVLRYEGGTPVFNYGAFSSRGGSYTLHVRFSQTDPGAAVEIRDAWGNVVGTGAASMPGDPGSDGSSRFVGWRLRYDNGATVLLQPGTTVYPYASCSYEAAYSQKVSIRPSDLSANAGDSLYNLLAYANVEQYNLPYGVSVADVSVTSNASDPLQAGTYDLYVSARLVDENYKDVDPSVAYLETQTGTLSVAEAYVPEPEPPQITNVTVTLYNQTITAGSGYGLDSTQYGIDPWADIVVGLYAVDGSGNQIDPASAPAGVYTITADLYYDQSLYSASLNNATLTIEAPVHQHTPAAAVQENTRAASCTEDGYYEEVVYCAECGIEMSRTPMTIPAVGHTAGEPVIENGSPATCTEDGSYEQVVYCTVCGTEISRETMYEPAKGHTAGEAVRENAVAPTCIEDGRHDEVIYCSVCSAEISRTTVTDPAVGHTAGEPVHENEVAAGCTEDGGFDTVVYCSVCGAEMSREHTALPAVGHNWGEWVVTTPATEQAEGVETRSCLIDPSHVETRPIPKLDHIHTPVKTDAVPAGCETDGSDAYWTCSGCGKLFSDEACTQEIASPVVVPATGHDWGEWTVTTPATETQEGVETRVCKNDESHTETRSIPPVGHTHTLTKVEAVPAACTQDGSIEYYKCESCGKLYKDAEATQEITLAETIVPATGHDWGEWTVTTPATETQEGVETRVCKNDESHTETRSIPPQGHTHTLTKVEAVPATYEKDGNIEYYKCGSCGKLYKDAEAKQEITLAETVIPKLSVTEVTVTVADQAWVVGSGTVLDQTRYTVTGFEPDVKYSVTLMAPGYTGGAGEYSITAELKGYDTAKYHVTVIPGRLKVAAPIVYPFTDSAQGYRWTQGSTAGLTMTVNADIRKFVCVKVDGAQLPENNYIVSSGSTVITLKSEYLKNLTPANHAISVEFTDGSAATTFVVSPAPVVTPTPLTITGRNVSKAYDGSPYNLSSYGQNTQGITTQFHLAQNGQPVGQAVNPGTYDIYLDSLTFANRPANGYNVTIVDSSGQVVAMNYQNTSVRIGSLTITGSNVTNVTVTVNDQSWTYDGTAHTPNASGYTVSGLQGNDAITVKLSVVDANGRTLSAVTDAGTYTIKADCTGYDSSRYNVTVAKTGTLVVNPYRLTLTAESAVKNYDGSPLRNSNVKATALLSGHKFRANDGVKFSVYDSRGNLIQNGPVAVGTYTKKVTDVHIVDANGIEVTSNYNITRIDGTLTINNSDGSPKTGDTNKLTLWIVLLAVSALLILAIATLFLRRSRKKGKTAQEPKVKTDSRPESKK